MRFPTESRFPVRRTLLVLASALWMWLGAPSAAGAQSDSGGLGLDLSDQGDKANSPAPPPAAPPGANDNLPMGDLPPAGDAIKPVTPVGRKDEMFDVGEKDVSLEDRVKSVQRKSFNKKLHFELTPHLGMSLNDAFYLKYAFGGSAAFHFSDHLALAGRFDYLVVQTSDNVSTAKRELHSRLLVSKPRMSTAADFLWTPIYGKASLFNSIVHFDLFVLAGAGVVFSQTSSNAANPDPRLNQGPHPATDLGVGQRYALNELLAFEWELIETLYPDTPGGVDTSQLQHLMTANVGLAFFLPPIGSER